MSIEGALLALRACWLAEAQAAQTGRAQRNVIREAQIAVLREVMQFNMNFSVPEKLAELEAALEAEAQA